MCFSLGLIIRLLEISKGGYVTFHSVEIVADPFLDTSGRV